MEKKYTGKDRVEAAFKREYADRVPVRVWYGGALGLLLAGVTPKQVRTEPDKYALVVMKAHEVLQDDTVAVAAFDAVMFAESAGDELWLTQKEIIEQARKNIPLLEEKSNFTKFKLPNLMQATRLPYYVKICEILSSEVADATLDVVIAGPWTTATTLRGAENLIFDTKDDPAFVRDLMRHSTEYTKMVGDAIAKTGVGILTIGDPASGSSVISPAMFREWSKPYLQEAIHYLKQKGPHLCLHICGKVDPIMEDMVATGVDAISIDSPSSLEKMIMAAQKKIVTIGNAATELFVQGTKEEIEATVRYCIDTASQRGAYILSSGCQVPDNAPLENVKHFLDFAREYGRYDRMGIS